jgi:hypothetical protein
MHEDQCYFFHRICHTLTIDHLPYPYSIFASVGLEKTEIIHSLLLLWPRSNTEIYVKIFQHSNQIPVELRTFNNVSGLIEVIQETGSKCFHEAISQCHILLFLVDPCSSVYFQGKKLTGSLPYCGSS